MGRQEGRPEEWPAAVRTYDGFFDLGGRTVAEPFQNIFPEGRASFEEIESVGKPEFVNGVEARR